MEIVTGAAIFGGYLMGILAANYYSVRLISKYSRSSQMKWFGRLVALLILLPAIFIGTVVGGQFGGGIGGSLSQVLGLGDVGIPIGLAVGIASTITLIVLVGVLLGLGLGAVFSGNGKKNVEI